MYEQHLCHWPGCKSHCDPKDWGCEYHWSLVPEEHKQALIRLYKPGQEVDKNPSEEYLDAAVKLAHYCFDENERVKGDRLTCI